MTAEEGTYRNHCIEIYELLWTHCSTRVNINQTAWVETQTNELIASLYERASFLRSQYSFSWSRYYLCFMEYEGLLLGLHEPVTGFCSELPYSSSLSHIWFFMYILMSSHLHLGLGSGLFLFSFLTEILICFPWNIWRRLQILKLLITQMSWASCYFLSLRSIYCPPHLTGRHRHWHHITKWLLPCIYRQRIGPIFVKCHFPTVEPDILPLKLWPLCCLLMDIYHHVMWCDVPYPRKMKFSNGLLQKPNSSHFQSLCVFFCYTGDKIFHWWKETTRIWLKWYCGLFRDVV